MKRAAGMSPFALSFLDTVSAGFGAAFFLFVIFASLPVISSGGRQGSSQFVEFDIWWNNEDAVLEFALRPPGDASDWIPLSGQEVSSSLRYGQLQWNERAEVPNAWREAYAFGQSEWGAVSRRNDPPEAGESRRVRIRILGPCPGLWQMGVALTNRGTLEGWSISDSSEVRLHAVARTSQDVAGAGLIRRTTVEGSPIRTQASLEHLARGEPPWLVVQWEGEEDSIQVLERPDSNSNCLQTSK